MEATTNERTAALVDQAVTLKKTIEQHKLLLDNVVAELQEIAERTLSDKCVKSTVIYGSSGNKVVVTSPVAVDVVSYEKLIDGMGEKFINEYAPLKTQDPVRVPDKNFIQVLGNIVLNNYMTTTLKVFLDQTFKLTGEQERILLKKLKGVYDRDLKTLTSVLGESDYDVELYHIQKIINYETIRKYLPEDMDKAATAIRNAVAVDERIKTEISYQKE